MNKELINAYQKQEGASFMFSMKIWLTFMSHCFYYGAGMGFMAFFLLFMGYFLNFYGLSDGLLVWGNVIFFSLLFIASFFALHQSLGRYVAVSALEEVLKPEPIPTKSIPLKRLRGI